jgi:hypothetical protein
MTLLSDKPDRWARQRAWRQRNPDKRKAHEAVKTALRKGLLVKEPCACGRVDVEAHHPSYDPGAVLDVVWVCRPCHRRLHRRKLVSVGRQQ